MEKGKSNADEWRLTNMTITEKLKYALERTLWSDCKISVGEYDDEFSQEFRVHKLILSLASSKLTALLQKKVTSPIKLTRIKPKIFETVLEYLYTDIAKIDSIDVAFKLYDVAEEFEIYNLINYSLIYIVQNMDCSNIVQVYQFAKKNKYPDIREKAMNIMKENTHEMFADSNIAAQFEYETILDLLDQNELNIQSEYELFCCFEQWIEKKFSEKNEYKKCDIKKLRDFAKPGIRKIRFLTMNMDEFSKIMHHTRLLVKEDFPNIVLNIVTPDLEYKMSDAYCKNRNSRICLAKLISNINSRMYVQRLIQNPITVENTNELTDVINFIVDKKIILYGLQIPAQLVTINGKFSYFESIVVTVTRVQSNTNEWMHFESLFHSKLKNLVVSDITSEKDDLIKSIENTHIKDETETSTDKPQKNATDQHESTPIPKDLLPAMFTYNHCSISGFTDDSETVPLKDNIELQLVERNRAQTSSSNSESTTPKSSSFEKKRLLFKYAKRLKTLRKTFTSVEHEPLTLDKNIPSSSVIMKKENYDIVPMNIIDKERDINGKPNRCRLNVDYGTIISVPFRFPIVVPKNYQHRIQVTLEKPGFYAVGNFNRAMNVYSNNVNFQLKGYCDTAFVTNIIFSL